MSDYTRNHTTSDIIKGILYIVVVLWVYAYTIFALFGWRGLEVAVFSIVGIFFVIVLYDKHKKKRRVEAVCKHGVAGALYGYKVCVNCQQEKAVEEQMARKKAEEEELRRKLEKERVYREWVQKIRLPEYLRKMHPQEFEHLVCDLFRRMGYEVEDTPYSGDGGIDGYMKKNGELSILQCKRVKGSLGEPILRDLFGSMHATGAKEGVVVTTGRVSTQARDWSRDKPIRILELDELVNFIRTYYKEDEVIPEGFVLHEVESAICPRCGNPLKVVNWKGKRILGCSAYPSCRYTTSLHASGYQGT